MLVALHLLNPGDRIDVPHAPTPITEGCCRKGCFIWMAMSLSSAAALADQMHFSAYSIANHNMPLAATMHMTSTGPYYGGDMASAAKAAVAAANGLGYAAAIPKHPSVINDTSGWARDNSMAGISDDDLRAFVRSVMDPIRHDATVTSWHITPEELRPWRAQEMRYLEIVADEVRRHDPLGRPVAMYNPNHRTTGELRTVANQGLDWVMKGVYITGSSLHSRAAEFVQRATPIIDAANSLGKVAVPVYQLSTDFRAAELATLQAALGGDATAAIRQVIRNDVYQGLILGAQGIQVWSGWHSRTGLTTFRQQFEAYGSVATDLNGPLGLADVFLSGDRRSDFPITTIAGPSTVSTPNGSFAIDSVSRAEIQHGGARFFVLANAANEALRIELSGMPAGPGSGIPMVSDLLGNARSTIDADRGKLLLDLDPLQTVAIKVEPRRVYVNGSWSTFQPGDRMENVPGGNRDAWRPIFGFDAFASAADALAAVPSGGTVIVAGAGDRTEHIQVSERETLRVASTVLRLGNLTVGGGSRIEINAPVEGALELEKLTIDEGSGGGAIDLGIGRLTIAADGIAAEALRADLLAGRNGGNWDGVTGIISTAVMAARPGSRTLGYRFADDGTATVAWAAPGDVNLDGQVDLLDLLAITAAGRFDTGLPTDWSGGDMNYDGVTDLLDLLAILAGGAYGQGPSTLADAGESVARLGQSVAVPEPTSTTAAVLAAALGAAGCRRRRLGRDTSYSPK